MNKNTTVDLDRELVEAEEELVKAKERLAELRRQLPREEVKDYTLKGWEGLEARLSSFFGDKKDLILIHNMGNGCSYCTMWADGFNGVFHHLENRAGFVVVSPNDCETQKKFALSRSWKFKMYSAKGTSFNKDMGFENEKGAPNPAFRFFAKNRTAKSSAFPKPNSAPATISARSGIFSTS